MFWHTEMTRSRRQRSKRSCLSRRINRRDLRPRFLIVCEGKKTEPNYFESFRVSKVVEVVGLGFNTVSLVREAIELMNQKDYTEVWCVFDKDAFSSQNFNAAIDMARANDMRVAYSNEAFEIWYLLHFNYHDTALTRHLCEKKLSACLGTKYEKNSDDMYQRLASKQDDAIRNAERLLQSYMPHNPASDNPCTTVHLLVQELIRSAV